MTRKKAPDKAESREPSGDGNVFPNSRKASAEERDAAREQELNDVDREVIGALTEYRDTLRARTPFDPGSEGALGTKKSSIRTPVKE
jgi:hypothetical protein